MQQIKYVLLLFCIPIFCFSQNNKIEGLVNEAYKLVIPIDFEYFNLVDSSFVLEFNDHNLKLNSNLDKFLTNNPDFRFSEFTEQLSDKTRINWSDYNIDKARIYTYDSIPKFATHLSINILIPYKTSQSELDSLEKNKKYNEVIVPVKKRWSDKRIKKEIARKWEERENNTRAKDKKYFRFSTPIFSKDQKYAIIQLMTGGDRSASYVFGLKNNKWTPLLLFDGYVH